ncbi:MAG: site-specific integrase [Tagaea sp.]|nr:site-specific integrase [Tagaea sp.]
MVVKGISKRKIDALRPGRIIADDSVRGFVARRLPSGKVTFGFRYRDRNTGARRWLGIGLFGSLTVEEARRIAQKRAGEVADNRDPLGEKEKARQAAHGAQTMDRMLDQFLSIYVEAKKLRTKSEIVSAFDHYVRPAIGRRAVASISRSDIVTICDKVAAATSPRRADTILAYLRKALNWYATRVDGDFTSPIRPGMNRVKAKDIERDRILSDDELRDLWRALPRVHPVYADILRVLLYSAQRRSEIAELRAEELRGMVAIIPASRTKTRKENVVPFAPRAQRIIASHLGRPPKNAEFVFWARGGGTSPFQGWSAQKKALDKAIAAIRDERGTGPMPEWHIHDLRRTARTLMSRAGVSADIAERVLSHAMPRMQAVYDRHRYDAEKLDALRLLEEHIHKIVGEP